MDYFEKKKKKYIETNGELTSATLIYQHKNSCIAKK